MMNLKDWFKKGRINQIFKKNKKDENGYPIIELDTSTEVNVSVEVEVGIGSDEMQGSWESLAFGYYQNLTIAGKDYAYYRADTQRKLIKYVEYGTFKIDGATITFLPLDGKSSIGGGPCRTYWDNDSKTQLHLWPAGSFSKIK